MQPNRLSQDIVVHNKLTTHSYTNVLTQQVLSDGNDKEITIYDEK